MKIYFKDRRRRRESFFSTAFSFLRYIIPSWLIHIWREGKKECSPFSLRQTAETKKVYTLYSEDNSKSLWADWSWICFSREVSACHAWAAGQPGLQRSGEEYEDQQGRKGNTWGIKSMKGNGWKLVTIFLFEDTVNLTVCCMTNGKLCICITAKHMAICDNVTR